MHCEKPNSLCEQPFRDMSKQCHAGIKSWPQGTTPSGLNISRLSCKHPAPPVLQAPPALDFVWQILTMVCQRTLMRAEMSSQAGQLMYANRRLEAAC